MAVAVRLGQLAKSIEGVQQWPYKAIAEAMEVIPRTLIQNAGASPIRVLTALRAKHAAGGSTWGIDGELGRITDMNEYGIWEPEAVKLQSITTAIEVRHGEIIVILLTLFSLPVFSSGSMISAVPRLLVKLVEVALPVVMIRSLYHATHGLLTSPL